MKEKKNFKDTLIKRGCSVGANATIVCGVTLGAFSFIGAGSVVTRDIPDFALAYGSPAKVKGWVSLAGNRLKFDKNLEAVDVLDQTRYRLVSDNLVELIGQNPYL